MEEHQKIYISSHYDVNSDLELYYLPNNMIGVNEGCSTDSIVSLDIYDSNWILLTKQVVDRSDLIYSTNCPTSPHISDFTHEYMASSNFAINFIISILILLIILWLPLTLFRKGYRRV